MQLSGYVPELIGTDIRSLITRALNRNNLPAEAIKHWCVHPGGTRILDAVQRALDLPEDTLAHSYAVLQHVGNMSSPTILFVLKRWEEQFRNESTPSSEPLLGLAFGPGLTMETFIAHYA
jgi:predicted naringenin-chalcone synthase